eukprot:CAMPEP_0113936132 /NCGR_PEP_ID=MMETSP1339-20121228/3106_1 /TAXON_ID=94617 /ORGANISM="Fibrocapsa japonica" /LENGTH=201 /DNA_ID=CAMNT_0000938489 /DNA_START=184 /DNA_END=789 /DNA_ORIENTATION=+ /assembly_acc=CAM_ASM_000762
MSKDSSEPKFVLDKFCIRQFDDDNYTGTNVYYDKQQFQDKVNEYHDNGTPLVDGYAPFCKHLFVPNFAGVERSIVAITEENRHLIQSEYQARTDKELLVLVRWIPKDKVEPSQASFLDIILYSREQINKENEAMGQEKPDTDAPWGIISVKAQDVDHEIPMQPITMMRNALGKEHGGSGVELSRDKYTESVNFWQSHVTIS